MRPMSTTAAMRALFERECQRLQRDEGGELGMEVPLRALITLAHAERASDIHLAPDENSLLLSLLKRLFDQPYGIALFAGPTGSGKTTSMFAGLKPHCMSGKSILTVEDPIEYNLPAACQTQVNRRAGYTFDSAIRHFLRHDPDIMLVGEIRDAETAEAALRAAETSREEYARVFGEPPDVASSSGTGTEAG